MSLTVDAACRHVYIWERERATVPHAGSTDRHGDIVIVYHDRIQ